MAQRIIHLIRLYSKTP